MQLYYNNRIRTKIDGFKMVLFALIAFSLSACMDDLKWTDRLIDEINSDSATDGRGVFILCEGNFMYGNASLSFYNIDKKTVSNEVFYKKNGLPLGDVACSMTIVDTVGFIVVNNSGKIYAINTKTFEYIGKMTGFTSPRHIGMINKNKAYVSDLYAQSISIIDPFGPSFISNGLALGETIGHINTSNNSKLFSQHNTEQFIRIENLIYTNCWSYDNKILVIDSNTDKIIDSIEVRKQPSKMVVDKNNHLWVLCDGGYRGSPYGYEKISLLEIDLQTRKIVWTYEFDDERKSSQFASDLKINGGGDTLYFINKAAYSMNIKTKQPEIFIEKQGSLLYSLGVDPVNSDVYISDAIDYMQSGVVYRYNSHAELIDSFKVGIIPGNFSFVSPQ